MVAASRMRAALFLLLTTSIWPTAAAAAEQTATPRVALVHDDAADLFVTGSMAYLDLMAELELNETFASATCRWCAPPSFDEETREALKWQNPKTAGTLGTVSGFVATPITAIGLTTFSAMNDGRGDEAPLDILLVAESAATAVALTEIAKQTFARARPAVYYDTAEAHGFSVRERNVSFFSGHSSFAFSVAVSAGVVSSERGYRLAPLVWSVGLPFAAFTAYSRIAADAHYLSDVVAGSLVGAGVGVVVPLVFHPPVATPSRVTWRPVLSPVAGGAVAGVAGTL